MADPSASSADFELPGAFYLGGGSADGAPLLLRSRELCTHAAILGQTGSGKTGLAVAMLEEAALDGVPAIVIDPKGDLTNLLLHFPELRGSDFEPWVDPAEADRKGLDVPEFAEATARRWQQGLADWGQDRTRIGQLAEAADFCVYTPGSTAGVPVSLLSSLGAPDEATRADPERLAERVDSTTSALLALIGEPAETLDARHIYLAQVLQHGWQDGRDLGLEEFIRAVRQPPFDKVGLMPLDEFLPEKDRAKLAMAFNNLLAAPGFSTWLEGEALDLDRMLVGPSGKPQISVFSIAHLDDEQRMFFVALLLEAVIGWMRQQSGTGSLRALLYMDEVFGYLPPTANPPSKTPMLTLLKQARAYGLGVVLATQNPVDLDYKALSNMGTWMIGRLQTERDVNRVIDGLRSLYSNLHETELRAQLAGLPERRFLLHRAGAEQLFFDVRWVLNYLAGPLTRDQIRRLMDSRRDRFMGRAPVRVVRAAGGAKGAGGSGDTSVSRPVMPRGVTESFAPLVTAAAGSRYRPWLLRTGRYLIRRDKHGIDVRRELVQVVPLLDDEDKPLWEEAEELPCALDALHDEPVEGAGFAELPGWVTAAALGDWKRDFAEEIYRDEVVEVFHSDFTDQTSEVGESREAFLGRIRQRAHEERDEALTRATASLERKLSTQEDQVRRARQRVEREREQRQGRWWQNIIRVITVLLGGLITSGNRFTATRTRSAGTALRGLVGGDRDLERAEENLEAEMEDVAELKAEIEARRAQSATELERTMDELEEIRVSPYKKDIDVDELRVVWIAR